MPLSRVRDAGIRGLKQLVWWAMGTRTGAKLLQLANEERQLYLHDRGLRRVWGEVEARLGRRVRAGPFTGLEYPSARSSGSAIFPKIVGSYEQELHPVIDTLLTRDYETVVDIGAAEGYYAVGLARRLPRARVHAFEMDPVARRLLLEFAQMNGVADRISVHGRCDLPDLAAFDLSGRPLIVSDCEGAELSLLDPEAVPALTHCDMVVELHSVRGTDPRALFRQRFQRTHEVTFIDVATRDPGAYPAIAFLPRADRELLLYERTDLSGWAFCDARNRESR